MKKHVQRLVNPLVLFLTINTFTFSQNFMWKKGTNFTDNQGSYGAIGVSTSSNNPGARKSSASWTDGLGNFWLFGGQGYDALGGYGPLSDLWKYNTTTNEWTWIKGSSAINQNGVYGSIGVPAPANNPGARFSSVTWIDATGNLWLFGGTGYDFFGINGPLNDLWKYNVTTNEWTWIKGSFGTSQFSAYGTQGVATASTTPGARHSSVSWKDAAGNFWLFGGNGYSSGGPSGDLNDLWRYDIISNQWTWVKGSNAVNQFGVYGTQGSPSASNNPGGRWVSCGWTDLSGDLWLFGGVGYGVSGAEDLLNDLWKFSITSNNWTWYKGSNAVNQTGTYGSQGVFSGLNKPGARYGAITWIDGLGDLWLFGGSGLGTGAVPNNINDLWRYNISSNQWKWVKGITTTSQSGIYGTQGVYSTFNVPGARSSAVSWKDGSNNLWLFGGQGFDAIGSIGHLNDLWKFGNCINPTVTISASNATVCLGETATVTASGASTYTWDFNVNSSVTTVTPQGSSTYSVFGADVNGCIDTAGVVVYVWNLPSLSITTSNTLMCPFQTSSLSANGASSYTWNNSQNGSMIAISPTLTSTYIVMGTDANGCKNTASYTQSVAVCASVADIVNNVNTILIYPNPNTGEFKLKSDVTLEGKLIVWNVLGQVVFEHYLNSEDTFIKPNLSKGVYNYRVVQLERKISVGKLVIE